MDATLSRPLRLALLLWLLVGLAISGRTILRPDSHTVFPVLARGAAHWWSDQPLYARYLPLDYFRYPPVCAVALTPFAAPGLTAGGVLWSWASLLVYGYGLWRFGRDVLPVEWGRGRMAALLALGLLGGLRGLWNAQSNALVVGLLLLGASAVVRQRWWTAAGLLAAAVWVKLTPLALALLLVALWPRPLAGRFLVALVTGGLVPFLTQPPGVVCLDYRDWLGHLFGQANERWPGFRDAWTVWLVLRHHAGALAWPPELEAPIDAPGYRAVQLLAAAAALAWCLALKRKGLPPRPLVACTVGMGTAWLMLFGPASEHATYVFVAPPLAWALLDRSGGPARRALAVAAGLLVLELGWGAVSGPLVPSLPIALAALPLGIGCLAAWLVGVGQSPAANACHSAR